LKLLGLPVLDGQRELIDGPAGLNLSKPQKLASVKAARDWMARGILQGVVVGYMLGVNAILNEDSNPSPDRRKITIRDFAQKGENDCFGGIEKLIWLYNKVKCGAECLEMGRKLRNIFE